MAESQIFITGPESQCFAPIHSSRLVRQFLRVVARFSADRLYRPDHRGSASGGAKADRPRFRCHGTRAVSDGPSARRRTDSRRFRVERRRKTGCEYRPAHIMSARWSPDGHSFLLTVADKPYPDFEQLRPRLMTVRPVAANRHSTAPPSGSSRAPTGNLTGAPLYFWGQSFGDTDFYPGGLFVCEGQGSTPRNLTEGSNYSVESFRVKRTERSSLLLRKTRSGS